MKESQDLWRCLRKDVVNDWCVTQEGAEPWGWEYQLEGCP